MKLIEKLDLVFRSIVNEVDIDKDTVQRLGLNNQGTYFKTNKVLALSGFRSKMAAFVLRYFFVSLIAIILCNFTSFIRLFLTLFLHRRSFSGPTLIPLCSNVHSLSNFNFSIDEFNPSSSMEEPIYYKSLPSYACAIPRLRVMYCLCVLPFALLYILYKTLGSKSSCKTSYLVNSYDLLELLVFSEFTLSLNNTDANIITDIHCQRWLYICASYNGVKVKIVQHGFISDSISLTHRIPCVGTVVLYDQCYQKMFDKFLDSQEYKVGDFVLPTYNLDIFDGVFSLLLISNPLKTEQEYRLLEALSSRVPEIKLIYRPHPRFSDNAMSSEIIISNEILIDTSTHFPNVDMVLNTGSFLGVRYQAAGYKVIEVDEKWNSIVSEVQSITSLS